MVMRRVLLFIPILLAFKVEGYAVELLWQRFELSSVAQVASAQGTFVSEDRDSRANQGTGDRVLRSEAATSQDGVAAFAEVEASLRQTNSVTGETFWMESDLAIGSSDTLTTVQTQIVTRASASMAFEMQIRSETPFQYEVVEMGGAAPSAPGSGGFEIRTASGFMVLDIRWAFNDSSHQSQGSLPAGTYLMRLFNATSADGSVTPMFVNHIAGRASTAVAVTFRSGGSVPQPAPTLNLVRGAGNSVVLEMANLQPGINYTIERQNSMNTQFWEYVTNFVAAGSEAFWSDTLRDDQTTFYRIRY